MVFSIQVYETSTFELYDTTRVNRKGQFVVDGLMDGDYTIQVYGSYATDGVMKPPEPGKSFSATRRVRVTGGGETHITIMLRKSGAQGRGK